MANLVVYSIEVIFRVDFGRARNRVSILDKMSLGGKLCAERAAKAGFSFRMETRLTLECLLQRIDGACRLCEIMFQVKDRFAMASVRIVPPRP